MWQTCLRSETHRQLGEFRRYRIFVRSTAERWIAIVLTAQLACPAGKRKTRHKSWHLEATSFEMLEIGNVLSLVEIPGESNVKNVKTLANELYGKYRFYRDSRSNEINIPAQLPCKRRVPPAEISGKIKRNLTRLPSRSALLKETRFSVGYQRDDEVMTPKRIRRSMSVIGAMIDT